MTAITTRTGPWIGLGNGRMFWPLDPRAEEVRIEDIAHSLANICRWGGRCTPYYSVAQHSLHVAQIVERTHPHLALRALLHDAAEAYVGDVITPIKRMLSVTDSDGGTRVFGNVESDIMEAIHEAFGIALYVTNEADRVIESADRLALATEARDLMGGMTWDGMVETNEPDLRPESPDYARRAFLGKFTRLGGRKVT